MVLGDSTDDDDSNSGFFEERSYRCAACMAQRNVIDNASKTGDSSETNVRNRTNNDAWNCCTNCKAVWYCSQRCRRRDSAHHTAVCASLQLQRQDFAADLVAAMNPHDMIRLAHLCGCGGFVVVVDKCAVPSADAAAKDRRMIIPDNIRDCMRLYFVSYTQLRDAQSVMQLPSFLQSLLIYNIDTQYCVTVCLPSDTSHDSFDFMCEAGASLETDVGNDDGFYDYLLDCMS